MYRNICRKCDKEVSVSNSKQFSNHVRWCGSTEDTSSKFILKCSCTICKKEIASCNVVAHFDKHNRKLVPKSSCLYCKGFVYSNGKFCSRGCSAKHNSLQRSLKNKKKVVNKRVKASWIGFCKVCGGLFRRSYPSDTRKCCSLDCRMKIVSLNRGRHKQSWLELSFSNWLDQQNVKYRTEVSFKNSRTGRWYFVDFLFEDKMLIIELDGSQHKDTIESDRERDEFLTSIGYTVIRVTHTEYKNKSKLGLVKERLGL